MSHAQVPTTADRSAFHKPSRVPKSSEKIVLKASKDCSSASAASVQTGAQAGLVADRPVWPDAQPETPSANLIKYRIAAGAAKAVQFYQAEMPRQDWLTWQEHLIRADLAVLSYAKGRKRATIIIHEDGQAKTRVIVTLNDGGTGPSGG